VESITLLWKIISAFPVAAAAILLISANVGTWIVRRRLKKGKPIGWPIAVVVVVTIVVFYFFPFIAILIGCGLGGSCYGGP
jgi:hypothetical protein